MTTAELIAKCLRVRAKPWEAASRGRHPPNRRIRKKLEKRDGFRTYRRYRTAKKVQEILHWHFSRLLDARPWPFTLPVEPKPIEWFEERYPNMEPAK